MAQDNDANGIPVPSWGPAYKAVAITKSDATDLTASKIRALWVGGAGDVAVKMYGDGIGGTAVTLAGVAAGTLIPVSVAMVMSTNTSATLIIGLS